MQWLVDFILKIFGSNPYLCVIAFSFLPVIEVRGAIPLGVNMGLNLQESFLFSLIGSFIASLIIIFVLPFVLKLLEKTKFYQKFLNILIPKIEKLKQGKLNIYLALMLFVAIPIPLTGVFTGSCLACVCKLNRLKSLVVINTGNIIAGILITLITVLFGNFSIYITLFFMIIMVVLVAVYLTKLFK